jgi:hypothetical protein
LAQTINDIQSWRVVLNLFWSNLLI